eukprot:TRINITY_DN17154_c0_g1_i1.p3 TRINITY_DN17154_c0_g1~~TRINITY_DN17154_c0_g1_i1.p3  ORF type:complete len:108 (-),score=51.96 TRINITY_DN17154_c0_g1_i1:352-675(-)
MNSINMNPLNLNMNPLNVKFSLIGREHRQATPENIARLRVKLSMLEPKHPLIAQHRPYLTDRTLHRFLTARNNSLQAACDMLLQHLEWRVAYRVEGSPGLVDEDVRL